MRSLKFEVQREARYRKSPSRPSYGLLQLTAPSRNRELAKRPTFGWNRPEWSEPGLSTKRSQSLFKSLKTKIVEVGKARTPQPESSVSKFRVSGI